MTMGQEGAAARVIVVAGLAVVAAGSIWWHLERPVGRPETVFEHCVRRFANGRLAPADPDARKCGQSRIEPAIAAAGQQRYAEVLAIFERAERLGGERVAAAIDRARVGGRAALAALPWRERQRIEEASRREFVLSNGLGAMTSAERALLPDAHAFSDPAVRRGAVVALGEAALDGTIRARVAGKTDAQLAIDPELAFFAGIRRESGETSLAEIESRVAAMGGQALIRLPWSDRQRIEQRSRNEFMTGAVLRALSEQDRDLLGDGRVIFDESLVPPLAFRAGRSLLSDADRAQLPDGDKGAFVQAMAAFVDREGRRILGDKLRQVLRSSRPSLGDGSWSGTLLAWNAREAAVRWGVDEASQLFGSHAVFYREDRSWNLVWR